MIKNNYKIKVNNSKFEIDDGTKPIFIDKQGKHL